jgi:hypothetical protein
MTINSQYRDMAECTQLFCVIFVNIENSYVAGLKKKEYCLYIVFAKKKNPTFQLNTPVSIFLFSHFRLPSLVAPIDLMKQFISLQIG